MNLSAKAEYACLAIMELARQYGSGQPLQLRCIAARHGIPSTFLVQILQDLKRAGMVSSTRGAAGGYQLTQAPEELTLADVLSVVEGHAEPTTCASAESPLAPVLMEVCQELSAAREQRLSAITLAELLARAAATETEPMWYI